MQKRYASFCIAVLRATSLQNIMGSILKHPNYYTGSVFIWFKSNIENYFGPLRANERQETQINFFRMAKAL
jgi:hypothetical protein